MKRCHWHWMWYEKKVLCSAEKSSVIWAEPHSRCSTKQFDRTERLVRYYIVVFRFWSHQEKDYPKKTSVILSMFLTLTLASPMFDFLKILFVANFQPIFHRSLVSSYCYYCPIILLRLPKVLILNWLLPILWPFFWRFSRFWVHYVHKK